MKTLNWWQQTKMSIDINFTYDNHNRLHNEQRTWHKIFEYIKKKFCHSATKHGLYFHRLSILTQIIIDERIIIVFIDYDNLIDEIDSGLHIWQ